MRTTHSLIFSVFLQIDEQTQLKHGVNMHFDRERLARFSQDIVLRNN